MCAISSSHMHVDQESHPGNIELFIKHTQVLKCHHPKQGCVNTSLTFLCVYPCRTSSLVVVWQMEGEQGVLLCRKGQIGRRHCRQPETAKTWSELNHKTLK
ncbi:hypothetical protein XENORESO_016207 [Xenotaenia resolanae]|uniref:Uncharacterized protein n=1 Tax=Xenotaenia resolanae TaxID=208358 RepID=A0ABV0WRF3_9TELE